MNNNTQELISLARFCARRYQEYRAQAKWEFAHTAYNVMQSCLKQLPKEVLNKIVIRSNKDTSLEFMRIAGTAIINRGE